MTAQPRARWLSPCFPPSAAPLSILGTLFAPHAHPRRGMFGEENVCLRLISLSGFVCRLKPGGGAVRRESPNGSSHGAAFDPGHSLCLSSQPGGGRSSRWKGLGPGIPRPPSLSWVQPTRHPAETEQRNGGGEKRGAPTLRPSSWFQAHPGGLCPLGHRGCSVSPDPEDFSGFSHPQCEL